MEIYTCGNLERKDMTLSAPLYRLDNGNMSVTVSAYGGYFTSIIVPDDRGIPGDIALGFSSLDAYEHTAFAPCGIVGRYANRIKDGRFSVNGKTVQVSQNDFPHHLHGGFGGFHRKLWDSSIITDKYGTQYLHLHHVSPDGDEGFPGTLDTSVFITLTDSNELCICFLAKSDKDTVCSLSNHMAVNLGTCRAGSISDHDLTVYSDTFTPADERGIPTGQILPVLDTPLDFRRSRNLGEQLALCTYLYRQHFIR